MSKTVAVFCGASLPNSDFLISHTQTIAHELAEDGYDLAYGGSSGGLMGVVANTFLGKGRHVLGIIPEALQGALSPERFHPKGAEILVVEDMMDRKIEFINRSDAFLILPGGWGTMDELSEVLTHRFFGDICPTLPFAHKKPTLMVAYDETEYHLLRYLEARLNQGLLSRPMYDYLFTAPWAECRIHLQQALAA